MGIDYDKIVEGMCMTYRHDFGLDKPVELTGVWAAGCGMTDQERDALRTTMRQLIEHNIKPVFESLQQRIAELEAESGAKQVEVQLNVIRNWPEGMQARLEHVWKDLICFIPNYKLYDLQRCLAEFGFTMKVYEDAATPHKEGNP